MIRNLTGVVRADALFGTPDVTAIVERDEIASMDVVIDAIVEVDGVRDRDSKGIRWSTNRHNPSPREWDRRAHPHR